MDAVRELKKHFVVEDSPTFVQTSESEIMVRMVFKRRLSSETMIAFLPSLLLTCCSYATSFFRLPNFFNAAIAANLTILLTITTIITRVMDRIAETSYIKWIDYWLLFCTFIPFVQVILITIIEWLRNEERLEQKRPKDERKDVGVETNTGFYEMSIGGKNVKVMLHSFVHFSICKLCTTGSPTYDARDTTDCNR